MIEVGTRVRINKPLISGYPEEGSTGRIVRDGNIKTDDGDECFKVKFDDTGHVYSCWKYAEEMEELL